MISFIIAFSLTRITNLFQTFQQLEKREEKIDKEIIFVCQENIHNLPHKTINLFSNTYNRPKALNKGVEASKGEIVVLLDSDRILPFNYFYERSKTLKDKEIVSTKYIANVTENISNERLLNGDFPCWKEERHTDPYMCKKTVFSGNTLLTKKTYWNLGGMDENLVGYGCHDTDMTMKAMKNSCKILLTNDIEIHLYHERDDRRIMDDGRKNARYFIQKWNINPEIYNKWKIWE